MLATTKQFLDDLGLASLEQLPLLTGSGADGQALASALAEQPSLLDPQQLQIGESAEALTAAETLDATPPAPPDHDQDPADEPVAAPTPPDDPAAQAAPEEPQE